MWCQSQGEATLGSTYLLGIITPNLPEVIRPRFLKKEDPREETQLSVKHLFQQEIQLFVVLFPVTYTHSCVSSCTDSLGFTVVHSLVFIVAQTLLCFLCTLSCVSCCRDSLVFTTVVRLSCVSCCTDSLLYSIARLSCVYCCTDPHVCFLLHTWGVPYCTDSCKDPVSSVASLRPVGIGSLSYTILWLSLLTVNLGSITGLPWWRNSFEQTNMIAK